MKLVACKSCHTQFDVTEIAENTFRCRCGETVENEPLPGVDAQVHRCGACGAIVAADAETCDYCTADIVRDGRNLSLICPECYARNEETSRFCTACGVAFRPQPVHVDAVELPCVGCGCLMPPRVIGGLVVNECPQCNGLWVPEDRFDTLIERALENQKNPDPSFRGQPRVSSGNPLAEGVKYRKCPVCEAFMHRRNYRRSSGVVIDCCHDHGTWLDADELEQIAGFILSGGLERADERDEAERRREGSIRPDRRAVAEANFQKILMESGKPRTPGHQFLDKLSSLLIEFLD